MKVRTQNMATQTPKNKSSKPWLRQEFKGFFQGVNKCKCGARMEPRVNSKGIKYLQHPIGIDADRSHLGIFPYSKPRAKVYESIQDKVADKVVDHAKSLQQQVDGLKAELEAIKHMSAREVHDKYHNPKQCWFVCDYGDDRSYD